MKTKFFLLFWIGIFIFQNAYLQTSKDTPRNILIVAAHPDDWECGMGGTAYMLKDKYKIHVVIATKGQRGLSKEPSEKTVAIRTQEAAKACKLIGADLHFLDKVDGDVYSDNAGIEAITKFLKDLDPVMIFTMWGIDVPDHAAVSNMTRMALYKTGMIHDREVYFFETKRGGQTNQFEPDLYVNISDKKTAKDELIRCHVCQNKNDALQKNFEKQAEFHGWAARCDYAEAFKTYYPITNVRWSSKRPSYTLLSLETPTITHPYENNKNVLIISTHPDDWELGMGGTALMMKDKFNVHILITTRGEAGMGADRTDEAIKLRNEQALETSKKINAQLHIMHFKDGGMVAEKDAVDSIMYWLNKIDPGMVFVQWPFDKPDHTGTSNAATKALSQTGFLYDREIYYYSTQPQVVKIFEPDFYINISDVIKGKEELITIHDLPSHKKGDLWEGVEPANKFYGTLNSCDYAEPFRTHLPLINHRWNKKTKLSLLKL